MFSNRNLHCLLTGYRSVVVRLVFHSLVISLACFEFIESQSSSRINPHYIICLFLNTAFVFMAHVNQLSFGPVQLLDINLIEFQLLIKFCT